MTAQIRKKHKKYFLLLFISFLLFVASLVGVAILRTTDNIRFCEPVTTSLYCHDTSCVSAIYGETPLGRAIEFSNKGNVYQSGYGFLRCLLADIDRSKLNPLDSITVSSGTLQYSIRLENIIASWEVIDSGAVMQYRSPVSLQSSAGFLTFYSSVFHWSDTKYLLIICLALLGLILAVFIICDIRQHKFKRGFLARLILIMSGVISLSLFVYLYFFAEKTHISAGLFLVYAGWVTTHFLISLIFFGKSERIQKFQLLAGVIFFLWFGTESILRFTSLRTYSEQRTDYYVSPYEPQINSWYYTREPNSKIYIESPEFRYLRRTNSLGLADHEPRLLKDSGEYRIIAMGDSFTAGDGAHADSTWLKFLEGSLNKNFPSRKFSYINAGIEGSDPFYEYVLLRDKLLVYEPDMVIVAMGIDLDDLVVRGGMERFLPNGSIEYREAPHWEWGYQLFFSFRLIMEKLLGYNELLLNGQDYFKAANAQIPVLKMITKDFDKLSKASGFRLVFVVYPQLNELKRREYIYWSQIIDEMKDEQLLVVDILKYYLEEVGMNDQNYSEYYWEIDGHHKSKGYEVFSKAVEKEITPSIKGDTAL